MLVGNKSNNVVALHIARAKIVDRGARLILGLAGQLLDTDCIGPKLLGTL